MAKQFASGPVGHAPSVRSEAGGQDGESRRSGSQGRVPDDLVCERKIPLRNLSFPRRGNEAEHDLRRESGGRDARERLVKRDGVQADPLFGRGRRKQGQGARRGKEGGGDERRIPVRVVPAAGISAAAVLVLVVELAQHDGGDKARKHAQPHR